jgi:hypothetical protein
MLLKKTSTIHAMYEKAGCRNPAIPSKQRIHADEKTPWKERFPWGNERAVDRLSIGNYKMVSGLSKNLLTFL